MIEEPQQPGPPDPPTVEYESPQAQMSTQVPTSQEIQAAKWFTIGFLVVCGVFTIGAVLIMIQLAIYFWRA